MLGAVWSACATSGPAETFCGTCDDVLAPSGPATHPEVRVEPVGADSVLRFDRGAVADSIVWPAVALRARIEATIRMEVVVDGRAVGAGPVVPSW